MIGGSGRSRLRSVLVFVQVALSFVLFWNWIIASKPGATPKLRSGILDTKRRGVGGGSFFFGLQAQRAKIFYEQMSERVRALPGVQSAALARVRPFSYADYWSAPLEIEGYHRHHAMSRWRQNTIKLAKDTLAQSASQELQAGNSLATMTKTRSCDRQ